MYLICLPGRYMEKKNGLLVFVNKELGCSIVLLVRIQCIHIERTWFLDKQTFHSSR